ncbi:hypothetical protein HF324_25590 [Chitinophaga oryzae]|uniref:Uncharacterized protein n=1 Tax=Chitinophaga oryzae TaxID=2725414 RepID=A0AAE7DA38_9BACT|nr:hypothetical protein [Chitinophaga oryzae]QJB34515.1 hypothetical protein HF329_25730 [Chitinophaga oryzae]QJB41033.1 hypothetical protein HF324_25590 [Chitinophaga oryzae]
MKNILTALTLLLLAGAATAQDKPGRKAPAKQATATAHKPLPSGTPKLAQYQHDSTARNNPKKSCCTQPSRTASLRTKKI